MDGTSNDLEGEVAAASVPWFLRSSGWQLVVLLVALVVPLGAFTAAVAVDARRTLEDQAVAQNRTAARLGAQFVESHFEGLARYVESYAGRHELSAALLAGDEAALRAQLRDCVESNARIDRVFITTPEGVERCDWPQDPGVIGKSFAFRDWYAGVSRLQRTYVSEVYLRAAAPRRDIVSIATPIPADDGRTLGYLVVQHTMLALCDRLAAIKPGDVGTVTLVDQHGHLAVARPDPFADPDDRRDNPVIRHMLTDEEASLVDRDPQTGVPSLLSFAPVKSIGWVVSAAQPTSVVDAPAVALQRAILLLAAGCLVVLLALGLTSLAILRRHHRALLRLQEQKDQLGNMIIHDLRNPLAATIASIDLAASRAGDLGAAASADIRRAATSARRLLALINDLVDVLRMEEGDVALQRAPRDLAALVRTEVDGYRPLAEARGIRLDAAVPLQPVTATVDGELLSRVLENLLSNAIKHTPSGGRIDVLLEADAAGRTVVLDVRDSGEGIAPEDLPRLFRKFARASGQHMTNARDTGLGLVFCRMAVELHGGAIEVHSEPGLGSSFSVRLPRG